MQGLADGYFVAPYTIGNYLAQAGFGAPDPEGPAFKEAKASVVDRTQRMLDVQGKRSARSIHIELGRIMWEYCGMARTDEGLRKALKLIPELREQFWNDVRVPGHGQQLNVELERAGRVADHLEFAELMCHDALNRDESCGGHFREEHQTDEGEAMRDDENFSHVSVWENQGENNAPIKHKEDLVYESVKMATRSYK